MKEPTASLEELIGFAFILGAIAGSIAAAGLFTVALVVIL